MYKIFFCLLMFIMFLNHQILFSQDTQSNKGEKPELFFLQTKLDLVIEFQQGIRTDLNNMFVLLILDTESWDCVRHLHNV